MSNEKIKELAHEILLSGQSRFFDPTLEEKIATALTTARKEARAEAFKEAVQIVEHLTCPAQFEGNWRNGYSHAQNDAFRAIEAAATTHKRGE